MAASSNTGELTASWNNGSVSPVDHDEEYEGEGDMHFREFDPSQIESKFWRIQPIDGKHKPRWRNCHTAVIRDDNKMIVRKFAFLLPAICWIQVLFIIL